MPDRIKILYLQPNSEIGGSDICLLRLVRALDRDRFDPVVVLPRNGPLVPLFEREGAQLRFVPMQQLRTVPSVRHQGTYLGRFWATVTRLRDLIQLEQADIVHTNSLYCLYGGFAARAAKRPHVWHLREIPPAIPVGRPLLARLVAAQSARVVAMSRACLDGVFGSRSVPAHASVLNEGIDLREFRPGLTGERIRRELGLPLEAPVVGFAARLDTWKGLDVFLKAAALVIRQHPSTYFVVAGGAPSGFERHEAAMRALAAQLGIAGRVCFTGWRYSSADMPEVMAALTVFSHTSIRPEPFGLVLIEAMVTGRPVVAARAGGPLEIISHGESGLLTAPGDPVEHARAVGSLLADPTRARALGEAGRRSIESRFSFVRFGTGLTALYDSVVQTRRPSSVLSACAQDL